MKTKIRDILKRNTMLLALVFVMIFFEVLIRSAGKGSLLSPANVTNLISQNAYVVILAIGMLLCILTSGSIDLSVGSVVCFVGAIAGVLIVNMHWNVYLVMLICIVIGTAIGAWQGYWIAYARIPAFIVTLAGMLLFRGLANVILQGKTISPFPKEEYSNLFNSFIPGTTDPAARLRVTLIIVAICILAYIGYTIYDYLYKKKKGYETENLVSLIIKMVILSAIILWFGYLLGKNKGMPVILIWLAVIVFIYSYFTSNTVPGRHFYAMGGNEKAAVLSGIDTNKVFFGAYTNMGFLAAIAALVCVARFDSASPSAGTNYEMDAIGSCFIGGASAFGGSGKVSGAIIGAILMGVLNNGMSILGIDANWQKAVKGLVLLAAVAFDVLSKQKKK